MNLAHLHLLLNHVPTVGFAVGLGLFLAALLRRSADLTQASLVVFFMVALAAIPAYLTGAAAQFVLRDDPNVSAPLIAAHQDAAMLGLIAMELTGFAAWGALWRFRRGYLAVVAVFSALAFLLMARAANIGGQIMHPEIAAAGGLAAVPTWPRAAAMGAALVVDNPWVWPICEILHFVGLCLLFGVVLLVNLRMLGFLRGIAFADVRRLLPWAMAGLAINIVTGMLFVLAAPDQYTQNPAFAWKMGLMLTAALTLLYPTMFDDIGRVTAEAAPPITARIIAVGSTALWVAVIFFGRFLPYLGSE